MCRQYHKPIIYPIISISKHWHLFVQNVLQQIISLVCRLLTWFLYICVWLFGKVRMRTWRAVGVTTPSRTSRVSMRDTDVRMTRGVMTEGGGKLCSKHKFKGLSLKEKCWNPGLHPSVTPKVNTAPRHTLEHSGWVPVYGVSRNT